MPASPSRADFASRLRHRPLRRDDVAEAMALVPNWLGLSDAQRARLPALWEALAEAPCSVCGVIEEMALPAGERLQGLGATLIMPAGWLDRVAPQGRFDPQRARHLARDIYAALLDGSLVPPGEREIGRLNAGEGVVFFALHYVQRHMALDDPYTVRLLHMANEAFRMLHAGYFVQAVYQQAPASAQPWQAGAGFRMRHEPAPGSAADEPVVYGLTRDEAAGIMPGLTARHIFEHQAPRFRFSSSQRRLLAQALFDERDDQLAQRLEVSVHGLKKLWRGIYDRIEDADAEFFGELTDADDGKRGPEKRRQVLAYVRQRPEELRPWGVA